jgi:hypothetical protein
MEVVVVGEGMEVVVVGEGMEVVVVGEGMEVVVFDDRILILSTYRLRSRPAEGSQ